ncbi:triose-phosphate isomerase [Candidatus Parcubacteria bacterium]|nr:triose-phosphate isomerase [Candidatus Parcubacteria bacterium]
MKSLIVANWKLNPSTKKEAEELFEGIKKAAKDAGAVICPPFVYLPLLKGLTMGAQDVFFEAKGAFTGEISPAMLKDLEVEYVIVGHSERRKHFNETDQIINKKITAVVEAGLKPIFCIGETKEEMEADKKAEVLERQITEGLKDLSGDQVKNVIVAYEPVWAIGTGQNCSVEGAMQSVALIRKILANAYSGEVADGIKILYGGSVNSKNAAGYIKEAGVDGLLIGGASLDANEFISIIESCKTI